MTHQYTLFDSVALPTYNQTQNHDAVGTRSTLLRSVGGLYDNRGSSEGDAEPKAISMSGAYVGELTYLVDESGNRLVDESGNYIIAGSAVTLLRAQVEDIRNKVRVRGTLWRARMDDTATLQWKTARLLSVNQAVTRNQPLSSAVVDLVFDVAMTNWHAASVTTTSVSAVDGIAKNLTISNGGSTVEDATFTVTRTSGTITSVFVSCTTLGLAFSWTGALGSGEVLTIDDGADTVLKGTADAYSAFALSGLHTAQSWLTLTQGTHLIWVTVVGGNATVAINYYVQQP